ncbi:hypothetical protein SY88_17045 [Clostridiales bacterium PH28_bin88]|nr:hypothetical protein SY88_17045 [Clostridiales bacterium PH28_bin88]
MHPQISFIPFNNPRRQRCDCCDRTQPLEQKVFLLMGGELVGDLELCRPCAEVLAALMGKVSEDGGWTVEQEWRFGQGGENHGRNPGQSG